MTPDKVDLYCRARDYGCNPVWRVGLFGCGDWHCTCAHNQHGVDSDITVITWISIARVVQAEIGMETCSYEDCMFIAAVALGCWPDMVGSEKFPRWRCSCPSQEHGEATPRPPLITMESLEMFKRSVAQ